MADGIEVIAIATGYYGGAVRNPGERSFRIANRDHLGSWMVEVNPPAAAPGPIDPPVTDSAKKKG